MYEKLYDLIKKNEVKGNFTYADVTDEMFVEAEKNLGLVIPDAYKWFISKFGQGGIGGIEVLGIGRNGKMLFVDTTIKFRSYGLPNNLVVIENCDEWLYCIDTQNNKIVMWTQGNENSDISYDNFEKYLEDRINDMVENM